MKGEEATFLGYKLDGKVEEEKKDLSSKLGF